MGVTRICNRHASLGARSLSCSRRRFKAAALAEMGLLAVLLWMWQPTQVSAALRFQMKLWRESSSSNSSATEYLLPTHSTSRAESHEKPSDEISSAIAVLPDHDGGSPSFGIVNSDTITHNTTLVIRVALDRRADVETSLPSLIMVPEMPSSTVSPSASASASYSMSPTPTQWSFNVSNATLAQTVQGPSSKIMGVGWGLFLCLSVGAAFLLICLVMSQSDWSPLVNTICSAVFALLVTGLCYAPKVAVGSIPPLVSEVDATWHVRLTFVILLTLGALGGLVCVVVFYVFAPVHAIKPDYE